MSLHECHLCVSLLAVAALAAAPTWAGNRSLADCATQMPQFTVSKPLRITVKGVDSYREVGAVPESQIRKDCEAYALDEARRRGLELCHAEGGALRGAGHLTTKLLEGLGTSSSLDRERGCSFEVVAAFTCGLPEESQRVRSQASPPWGFAWVNQREIPAWDGKVRRSRHELYIAADWEQSKAATRAGEERPGGGSGSAESGGADGDFTIGEAVNAYLDAIVEQNGTVLEQQRRAIQEYEIEMSQAQQARDKAMREAAEEAEREARRSPYTLPQ